MDTEWLQLAQSNEESAMILRQANYHRAAVSRFYYGAYSAIQAILLHKHRTPPPRGNWGHEGLPEHFKAAMRGTRDALVYALRLGELYDLRVVADYVPSRTVDEAASQRSRQLAGPVIRLAERILQS